jgi:hypothetical protein
VNIYKGHLPLGQMGVTTFFQLVSAHHRSRTTGCNKLSGYSDLEE